MPTLIEPNVLNTVKRDLLKRLPTFFPEGKVSSIRILKRGADFSFDLQVGTIKKRIVCEVKSVGEPRYLFQAIQQLKFYTRDQKDLYPLIAAPYISEQGRSICKESGVGYMDLVGNLYLNSPPIFIERESVKEPPKRFRIPTDRTILAPKSSRVLRTLLQNPEKTWNLTTLAQESDLYIRQVWLVVNALADKGFIEKKRGAVSLIKPKELLDYWASHYDFSKNIEQSYYSFARSFDEFAAQTRKAASSTGKGYAFTRHSGASLVAPFVRFTDVHLYCDGELEDWVKALELKPVEFGGTIHLISPYDVGVFYQKQEINGSSVVCNIQLYLDLITYPARGKEQAEFLREKKIGF